MTVSFEKRKAPFRADHIGSLKRPAKLLQARVLYNQNEISKEVLTRAENEAIEGIVKLQREVGIKSFTDGEFRRHMFYDGFFDNMEGTTYYPELSLQKYFNTWLPTISGFLSMGQTTSPAYLCTAKLNRPKTSVYKQQFEFLKSTVSAEELPGVKLTIVSPFFQHLRHGAKGYAGVYKNDEEYFQDIIKLYRAEVMELYEAGLRNLQIDDPWLACWVDENMLSAMKTQNVDAQALLDQYIEVYAAVLKDLPSDLVKGIGNYAGGKHWSAGGYDNIAISLFNKIDVDVYYLEWEDERSGGFEPLKHLPRGKKLVLGLVSSKVPTMENEEQIISKLQTAAKIISEGNDPRPYEEALNQLCISPQCGFASHSSGNPINEDVMKSKLKLCVQVAKKVWGPEA